MTEEEQIKRIKSVLAGDTNALQTMFSSEFDKEDTSLETLDSPPLENEILAIRERTMTIMEPILDSVNKPTSRPRSRHTIFEKRVGQQDQPNYTRDRISLHDPLSVKSKKPSKSVIISLTPQLSLSFELDSLNSRESLFMLTLYRIIENQKITIGTTEESTEPKFKKQIVVKYEFEQVDTYCIEISSCGEEKRHVIGSGTFVLGNLIQPTLTHNLELVDEGKMIGAIQIRAEKKNPYSVQRDPPSGIKERYLDITISADVSSKGDYYMNFFLESSDISFTRVYQSEVATKTKSPSWDSFSIELSNKVSNDGRYLKIEVVNCAGNVIVGKALGIFSKWKYHKNIELLGKKNQHAGSLAIILREREEIAHQMNLQDSFVDYVQNNMKFNVSFLVDFTKDNLPPRQYGDLHSSNDKNQYVLTMRAFQACLDQYKPEYSIHGYGYKHDKLGTAINIGNPSENVVDSYGRFIEELFEPATMYKVTKEKIIGQNEFSEILEAVSTTMRKETSIYNILIFLIPNDYFNLSETLKQFIYAANHAPISIIIVGIGCSAFKTLRSINPDPKVRTEKTNQFFYRRQMPYLHNLKVNGLKACREVFQFTTFESHKKPLTIASSTLKNVPVQIVKCMTSNGITTTKV